MITNIETIIDFAAMKAWQEYAKTNDTFTESENITLVNMFSDDLVEHLTQLLNEIDLSDVGFNKYLDLIDEAKQHASDYVQNRSKYFVEYQLKHRKLKEETDERINKLSD